ncbi:MAG: hypothetical protein ACUVWN_01860 [bacterium]
MAAKFYFDFRDVFRAGRMGFKGKKMMIHFLGLLLGYVIYEILVYLSLIGSNLASDFWATYGLRPVFIIARMSLPLATNILMVIGAFIWIIIYFLFSTAVCKVTIEELRGDEFYSMKDALKFAFKQSKTVYLALIGLIAIFLFCLLWPSLVGLIDLIPKVELAAKHFGTPVTMFLTIPVYFIGLFMVLTIIAFIFGIVLLPAISAVTGEDTFENLYQLFSAIWNQPWRLVVYAVLLDFVLILGFYIFTAISIAGMYIAYLPSMLLAKQDSYYFADVIARSLKIIGANSLIQSIPNAQAVISMPWTLDLSTFFFFASLIIIAGVILAYPLSILSVGYTIIYVILRMKTTDENMLEVKEEEKILGSEEEKKEEPEKEEKREESTEKTEPEKQEGDAK